jgi:hypothetical protein
MSKIETTTTATTKVSKTKLARETAVAVLKRARRPMAMAEIVERVLADKRVVAAGVPEGTVRAQVNFALAEEPARIVRVDRGVYVHAETPRDAAPVEAGS